VVLLRQQDRGRHGLDVVPVNLLHMPVAQAEAGEHVVALSDLYAAIIGHPVVVPEKDELAQAQMSGERDHLLANAFLQAAVADQRVGVMIDDLRPEPFVEEGFGDGHAGGIGNPLAERAGRRLDAAVRIELRMTLAMRAEFPEGFDFVDGDLLVTAQVEKRVEQHRPMPVRLHEAVAVEPQRILRIELQMAREKGRAGIGGAQRRAGVTLPDALDRVDGQETDCIGHQAGIDGGHSQAVLQW